MIRIPNIANYKPFYIQTKGDAVAKNTTEWGLIAKTNPYPLLPNPKEPYRNEWHDEDGDDEYVDDMHYESIEFTVAFYIKATDSDEGSAEEVIRKNIDRFFGSIRNGEFCIYDSYNGIGRRKVRYAGYSEETFSRKDDWAKAVFEITFKVNDPVTRMVMKEGKITAE